MPHCEQTNINCQQYGIKRDILHDTNINENEDAVTIPEGGDGVVETSASFEDLGLGATVLTSVKNSGYTVPTPIQAKAIPEILKGRDVMGIAQTGTGKTASFVLPMLEILSQGRAKARMPRTIILEPTRELAAQVAENFEKYGQNQKLSMALLIGGVSFGDQDALLMKGVDVLIATPGRLLDQFERGKILMSGVQMLVIDEADRMLDMGFIPDIERIVKMVPFTRQTLFFSATMAKEIEELANKFLHTPVRIEVARPNETASTISQYLVKSPYNDAKHKRTILRNLINNQGDKIQNAIVFCNRKRDVDIVSKSLNKYGINAEAIHGDLQQSQRTAVLDGFRAGAIKILVASDVAARGLDVSEVSHVFNYDVPSHAEDYVHRIGRTGRAGRSGCTFMIATPYDAKYLEAVRELIKNQIDEIEFDVGQNDEPVVQSRPSNARNDGRTNDRSGKGRPEKSDRPQKTFDRERSDKKPASSENPRAQKPAQKPAPRNNDSFEDRQVKGFGDNAPSFMFTEVTYSTKPEDKPVEKVTKKPRKTPVSAKIKA